MMDVEHRITRLEVQVADLDRKYSEDIKEILTMVKELNRLLTNNEIESSKRYARYNGMGSILEKQGSRLDDIERLIRTMESRFAKYDAFMKIVVYILSSFGVSIIALIWTLITGQASIVFK